jgi:hypothetical protein
LSGLVSTLNFVPAVARNDNRTLTLNTYFGDGDAAAAIAVTNWDERCSMVNFDPDSGRRTPEVLKAVIRARNNKAGVYGTVVRCGRLAIGQPLYFTPT